MQEKSLVPSPTLQNLKIKNDKKKNEKYDTSTDILPHKIFQRFGIGHLISIYI